MTTDHRIQLYATALSANGRKVLAVTKQLNLDIDVHEVNVYQGEGQTADYLKVNPQGKIPALVHSNLNLSESNAILMYLARFESPSELYPQDISIEAKIHQWLFWEASLWQPVISRVIGAHVGHHLVPQYVPKPTSEIGWQEAECLRQLNYLDNALEGQSFLINNRLSIADFSVMGMMTYFHFAEFPFNDYPNLSRFYQSMNNLNSWQETRVSLWES